MSGKMALVRAAAVAACFLTSGCIFSFSHGKDVVSTVDIGQLESA